MFTDPRKVLAKHGLKPKRGFSQNFLCAPPIVAKIADACELGDDDPVVELGPGCGTLTGALLARGGRVVAIEPDADMRAVLAAELPDPRLQVRAGDATRTDYRALADELGGPPRVVGNLPYAVTGAILRRLTEAHTCCERVVVMVQREVAERLLAPPGSRTYGALTVFTTNVFELQRVAAVPRGAFHPVPKVASTVVRLTPRTTPRARSTGFEPLVRAAFQARRKTLRNAVMRLLGVGAARAEAALAATAIDGKLRPEQLAVEDFDRLAAALERIPP